MLTTLAQIEKQVDAQITDPLYPEVTLVCGQVEHFPGVREGGELEEIYFTVKNRVGSLGDRLRTWVQSEYGSSAWLSDWRTVPTSRQLRAEAEAEEPF